MTIDATAVARVLGIETSYDPPAAGQIFNLPQRIAVIAQGASASSYPSTKFTYQSAVEVGSVMGFGSPAHLIARELLPTDGDGVGTIPVTFYPLSDAGSSTAAAGDITPSGTQTAAGTYYVVVNKIRSAPFTIAAGASVAARVASMVAAINAVLEMPVIAADGTTKVNLTSKWKGVSANGIVVEVEGESLGTTFAITQPTGGTLNPTVDSALAQIGNVWETLVINALDIADSTALATISTFGEGRWGALVRKPFVCFTGNTAASLATAITPMASRKTDRVNCQLVSPGSKNLPFVVAARQVARIAKVANSNPPTDYGSQRATGLTPGADSDQWDYASRDAAVKGGSSTVSVRDGVVTIEDVVTFYRPTGDPMPAYRYVVDIIKLQNVLYNIDLEFAQPEWDGAPLIPDGQPTTNPNARKPKAAKAAANAIVDALALAAILSDPKTTKAATVASIDSQNPKRLNLTIPVKLSGNANVKAVGLKFGFYFGSAAVVG